MNSEKLRSTSKKCHPCCCQWLWCCHLDNGDWIISKHFEGFRRGGHNTWVVLTMGIESLARIWTKARQAERFGLQTVFHPLIVIVIGIFSVSKTKEITITITVGWMNNLAEVICWSRDAVCNSIRQEIAASHRRLILTDVNLQIFKSSNLQRSAQI